MGDCWKCKGLTTVVITRGTQRYLAPCYSCCGTGWLKPKKTVCPNLPKDRPITDTHPADVVRQLRLFDRS